MFYLRPGNLFKDFWVEKKETGLTSRGRPKSGFNKENAVHLLAVLAEAKPAEIERFRQLEHPITHTITQRGRPKAEAKDRLIHGDRIFMFKALMSPASLAFGQSITPRKGVTWMEINLQNEISGLYNKVTQEAKSRGVRAANELRSASLQVLRGQRSGRIYRKPFTKHATYQASAPDEPPAVRSGTLRRSWKPRAQSETVGGEVVVCPAIWSDVKYAPILQEGSPSMKPRPFESPIIEKAKPAVLAIFQAPYLTK